MPEKKTRKGRGRGRVSTEGVSQGERMPNLVEQTDRQTVRQTDRQTEGRSVTNLEDLGQLGDVELGVGRPLVLVDKEPCSSLFGLDQTPRTSANKNGKYKFRQILGTRTRPGGEGVCSCHAWPWS